MNKGIVKMESPITACAYSLLPRVEEVADLVEVLDRKDRINKEQIITIPTMAANILLLLCVESTTLSWRIARFGGLS